MERRQILIAMIVLGFSILVTFQNCSYVRLSADSKSVSAEENNE